MRNFTIAQFASAIAFVLVCPSAAQEFKPFPKAQITEVQWNAYFDEVNKAHGSRRREFPAEHLVVFEDRGDEDPEQRGKTLWAFTTPEHPAHPAWVTRQVVNRSGKLAIDQIGYFAGDEQAFAKLFQAYRTLTEQTTKRLEEKLGP